MKLLHAGSLAKTVDAVNAASFSGAMPGRAERRAAARWIAARQGRPGAYSGLFAPTARDYADGLRVFTGERIASRAGLGHILGEEAGRALRVLNIDERAIREAVQAADTTFRVRLDSPDAENRGPGTYCCGICSVSLWRHLAAGGLDRQEARLAAGLASLRRHRDDRGRWRIFPFFYTLLALSEIDLPAARAELRHAAPDCERLLQRRPTPGPYSARRRRLAERILSRC